VGGQQRPGGAPSPFASRTPEPDKRPMGRPVSELFGSKPPARPEKADDEEEDEDEGIRYDPLDDTP
jgi:hypothetical protein